MFPHCSAAVTSLDGSPARLRSADFCLPGGCGVGGAAALLSAEQPRRECELGLWAWPKSAEDSARAAVCDSPNAAVSAGCLSADASSFRQHLSHSRLVNRPPEIGHRPW